MPQRRPSHANNARGSGREYHIVVLGAGGVGKSCLTADVKAQFVQGVWIEHYDPTIEDVYRKQIEVDGRQCVLEMYGHRHGFLMVFSITSLNSLEELSELREQIIRTKDDPNTPLVIVGNKSDLEEDRAVSRALAFAVSQSWGNTPYYETSARRRANVDEAFVDLCRQIIRKDATAAAAPSSRTRHLLPQPAPNGGGSGSGSGGSLREYRVPSHHPSGRQHRPRRARTRIGQNKEKICTIL
ncbi:MAG: Ras- protein rsr1 [Phylliscum demangeonii]|nr:MAG: Ras- protein rsr1 [Phylliscum demangeonii]